MSLEGYSELFWRRMEMDSKTKTALLAATLAGSAVAAALGSSAALAQAKEQFFPVMVYRTGAYAPDGIPFANGYVDYLKLVNARDGGINGVKITYEECDHAYATDRGVECYERLKNKGPTGATAFHPLSTGVTLDRKSTRLNSSHIQKSRMPSSA